MNRYELYLARKPSRWAWKQGSYGPYLGVGWYPTPAFSSLRGLAMLQNCDTKGREPA